MHVSAEELEVFLMPSQEGEQGMECEFMDLTLEEVDCLENCEELFQKLKHLFNSRVFCIQSQAYLRKTLKICCMDWQASIMGSPACIRFS